MEEFSDFYAFIESIDSYGKAAGIVKVIPPPEWRSALPPIHDALQHVRVRNPIVQHIIGCQGVYQQTNVEKRRPYTLNQWHSLCKEPDHRTPDLSQARTSRATSPNKKRPRPLSSDTTQNTATAAAPDAPPPHVDGAIPLEFDLHDHNEAQFTDDYCKELERIYWRNLTFTQPMYGADMAGSLFDDSVSAWNVSRLDNILNQIDVVLPGVNTPYLYFGMWKATFPWHVEDMDLYSINYLHFGAPKQWYAIPGTHSKKFESVMQNTFFQQSKKCPEFLRHKTHLASPSFLANNGVPVHRCVQHEGEFMITFPFGYHSGYNLGFNCAESVNFALSSWVDIGKRAKACHCISDSVTIDMSIFDELAPDTQASSPLTNDMDVDVDMATSDARRVHQICAESIPETYLERSVSGKSFVAGIDDIHPGRWKLTCQYCHQKRGACMQCCYGKCCRAFHASCAQQAGATIQRVLDETQGTLVVDGYCVTHDPKRHQAKARAQEEENKRLMDAYAIGSSVNVKWRGGGAYHGIIQDHVPQRKSSRVTFDDGVTRSVQWKDLTLQQAF
ncbi:JmjC domain, hydroxylase-domain-containing protein [Gongronella butleri]|nr:JmjC domain, hydroxylase-domain-containing protein [Gongronella butleri]